MAGTLLLIKKEASTSEGFKNQVEFIRRKVQEVYEPYYSELVSHETPNGFWLSFYKDKDLKSYTDSDGNYLVYEGVVFALNETKRYTANELWNIYLKKGPDFINECDGHFVIKIYDSRTNSYHVFSDILRSHTNYLLETDDAVLFTPFSIISAAVKAPELDLDAFNEYMWRYYIVSNRSLLKGVSKIKPAAHYSFSNNSLNNSTYWNWPKEYTQKSLEDCIHDAAENMKETARLIDDSFPNPCIDFTMGQDSRQVVAAFVNQGLPFNTSIFGKDSFEEVRVVKNMCKRHGIEFNNIQLGEEYALTFKEHLKKVTRVGSAEEPVHLLARINDMRTKQMEFGSVAMNGCDGHFYKNGLWDELYTFNLYREPKYFNTDLFIKMRALSKNYPDEMFNDKLKEVKSNSKKYYKAIIAEAIKGYESSPVSMQVDRFDIYHWLNFLMAATQSANKHAQLFSPLLFRRNLELAIQVPVKWKWNLSHFQRGIVWNLSKELAREKTDFGGVSMKPLNSLTKIPFLIRYFWFQSTRLRNKLKTKMGFKVVTHLQEAWDYLPLYKQIFENEKLRTFAMDQWAIAEIMDEKGMESYMKRFDDLERCSLNDFEHFFKMLTVENLMRDAKEFACH